MASDDVILREHTLSRKSTWEEAMRPFNIGKLRASVLPTAPGPQLELLMEFHHREGRNLARLLDARAEARHQELLDALRSVE